MKELMHELEYWGTIYELSFQFWPHQNSGWVCKYGIEFWNRGGRESMQEIISETLEYVRGINPKMYREYKQTI